jgi:hypothetical protein
VTFQCSHKVSLGVFVVASDTQCSVGEMREESIDRRDVKTVEHRSKTWLCQTHDILVAHAGEVPQVVGNPSRELADYLSSTKFDVMNSSQLENVLVEWGKESRYQMGDKFLIVSPKTKVNQVFKMCAPSRACPDYRIRPSSHFVSGDETNAAVFWPQFFGVGVEEHSLGESIAIAAVTIVMAHKLDNRYIGGLEVWYYSNGAWTFLNEDQCKPLWNDLRNTACGRIKNELLQSSRIPL